MAIATLPHEFVEYTPREYLMIDIATNFGDGEVDGRIVDLDKVNFEQRIDWFLRQQEEGKLTSNIQLADKPALYFAGLQAYQDSLDNKPIGYTVSMDACSSGLQILAALANCEKSALRCGVVPTGDREDAYMSLFQDMLSNPHGISLKATRSDLKKAVMTSLYGSKAQPRKLFGEGTEALELFYSTMEEEIPGAWELNLALKSLWQPFETNHSWILPDNFHVQMDVEALQTDEVVFLGDAVEVFTKQLEGSKKGLSLSPNIVHSIDGFMVREMTRRCYFDKRQHDKVKELCRLSLLRKSSSKSKATMGRGRKRDEQLKAVSRRYRKSGFLSARVIDLIDEHNISLISATAVQQMIGTFPSQSFPLLAIHDCFRAHPNYMNDLRRQYVQILADLAGSDILSDIATQITGERQVLRKVGNIADKIVHSNYALS